MATYSSILAWEIPWTEEPSGLQSVGLQRAGTLIPSAQRFVWAAKQPLGGSLGREDPLEEEMATHSSILTWRIPWTEEPGGLQSMGWQRVGMFNPHVQKIPWRRKWQPTPVFLPGEFHGQRSLLGYSPWGRKESQRTTSASVSGSGREPESLRGRPSFRSQTVSRRPPRKTSRVLLQRVSRP